MRNLKKILALVLALVMSLSLMTVAGATETTSADSAANAYATAAEVLQGLKVLEGYPDGDMHYEDHLTRAHAAAVFYRVDTKDVDNKNKDLYTNAPFSDVAADHWGRGYIAYCYDNKIIKGMGDGTFGDKSPLTGYQVLVMALRELGYGQNNEFDGDNYQIKTASTATQIGMLKGVTPIDQNRLGEPATRGLMAQIVFNMLLQDTVRYNALYQTYESEGKGTLGEQKFDLEEVEGVIVANEYAGIERGAKSAVYGTALSEGQTALRDDEGNIYEVNYSTKLEDLGLTRVVYTIKQAARDNYKLACLSMDDPDNDKIVYEDGKKVDNITKTAVNVDANTERYINFGETSGTTTTKIKVTYQFSRVIKEYNRLNASLAATAFRNEFKLHTTVPLTVEEVSSGRYRVTYRPNITDRFTGNLVRLTGDHTYSIVESPVGSQTYHYRVEIEPKAEFNAFDKEMVYGIFRRADLLPVIENQPINTVVITGEVFRGTQSVTDYSDAHSYEQFEVDCLTLGKEHDNSLINSNKLGWWLKIIDNDKDGYADWIFQTRYTVAEVTKKAKDGTLTLDTQTASWATDDDGVNSGATSAKSYPGETIEAGDVVYYATIDGANWAWKCEEVPGKVDVVNRNDLTVKLVGNDTVYTQSAVHEHTASEDILSGVINMSGTTNVKLYLDKYDNMAAFAQDISGKFALLTDGWRQTTKNGADYAVKVWDQETKSIKQYDVTEGGARFIGNADTDIDANSWNRIREFSGLNNGFYTYDSTPENRTLVGVNFTSDTALGGNTLTRRVRTMVAYMETDGETARLLPVDTVYDVNRINDRGYRMIDMNRTIPLQATENTGVIYRTTNASDILRAYDRADTVDGTLAGVLDDSTRVRALSSTTYYFVYHTTWNASTTVVDSQGRSIYVDEVKGFAAANQYIIANNVVTNLVNHIEDVYVVGREARDVVVTNDDGSTTANAAAQNNVYYTADVVVVELDANYYGHNHNVEEVFIYDFPEVITNDRYENVKAIRADGRNDVNLKIDLGLSRTYTEAAGKFTNETLTTFRPGLYWLHRSYQTNSEDIWFIDPMTHFEIRDAGHYDAGTVDTATFTNSANYAEIRDWVCKGGNIATADAVSIVAHNEALAAHAAARPIGSTDIRDPDRNPFALNAANNIRSDAENSNYYKLSYSGSGTIASPRVAKMTSTDIKDCLGRETVGTDYDGLNQVLVRWANNPATGEDEIVYAVSFNHDPYAQQIWRSVLKNPDVGVLRLTFVLGAGNSVTISDVTPNTPVRERYTVPAMPATVTNRGVVKVLIRDRSASGRGYSDDITFRMTFSSAAAVPVAGVTDGRWTIFSVTNVVGNTYDIVLRPNAGVQVLSTLSDYVCDANAVFITDVGLVDLAEDILKNPTSYTSTTLGYDLKDRLNTIIENRETPGKYDDDKVWLGDKVELPEEDLAKVEQAADKLPSVKDPTPGEPSTPNPEGPYTVTFATTGATVTLDGASSTTTSTSVAKGETVTFTVAVDASGKYTTPIAVTVANGTTLDSSKAPTYTLGPVNANTTVTVKATAVAEEDPSTGELMTADPTKVLVLKYGTNYGVLLNGDGWYISDLINNLSMEGYTLTLKEAKTTHSTTTDSAFPISGVDHWITLTATGETDTKEIKIYIDDMPKDGVGSDVTWPATVDEDTIYGLNVKMNSGVSVWHNELDDPAATDMSKFGGLEETGAATIEQLDGAANPRLYFKADGLGTWTVKYGAVRASDTEDSAGLGNKVWKARLASDRTASYGFLNGDESTEGYRAILAVYVNGVSYIWFHLYADVEVSFEPTDEVSVTLVAGEGVDASTATLSETKKYYSSGNVTFDVNVIDTKIPVVTTTSEEATVSIAVTSDPAKVPSTAAENNGHKWTITVTPADTLTEDMSVTLSLTTAKAGTKAAEKIGTADAEKPANGLSYPGAYDKVGITVVPDDNGDFTINVDYEKWSAILSEVNKSAANNDYATALLTMRKNPIGTGDDTYLYVGARYNAPSSAKGVYLLEATAALTNADSMTFTQFKAVDGVAKVTTDWKNNGLNLWAGVASGAHDATDGGPCQLISLNVSSNLEKGKDTVYHVYMWYTADEAGNIGLGEMVHHTITIHCT